MRATIAFARALGLVVTAEGIETQDQLERLRAMGCDLAQGYLFWAPLEADALGELLAGLAAPESNVTGEQRVPVRAKSAPRSGATHRFGPSDGRAQPEKSSPIHQDRLRRTVSATCRHL